MRVQLLESHITKKHIWELYSKSCNLVNFRPVSYTLFTLLWNKLIPYIIIAKPRTDLCNDCQKNNNLILKTANVEESQKISV